MKTRQLFWAVSLILWCTPAAARELRWRELDVHARLDERGHLQVSERHQMVFSGDWNGGERSFNVREEQDFVFDALSRVTPDGSVKLLTEGSLREVDEYGWSEPHVLRWRSRAPSDPSFDDTELGYRIEYELFDVLGIEGERDYRLAHEFAFTGRPGVIEHFQLHLEIDPKWESDQPSPIEIERHALAPDESVVLSLPVHYSGTQLPGRSTWLERRLRHLPSHLPLRLGLIAAMLATTVALWRRLGARARVSGHLEPLTPDEKIDEAWVTRHVLANAPEVVGAIHHAEVGPTEVAAVLARLEQEGKVRSTVHPPSEGRGFTDLELELLVPRESLTDHEQALVAKLFFAGNRTSTDLIRKRYESSGFNPAHALGPPLNALVNRVLAVGGKPREHLSCLAALITTPAALGLNAIVMQMLLARHSWQAIPAHVGAATALFFFGVSGAIPAALFRDELIDPSRKVRPLRVWVVVACLVFAWLMLSITRLGPLGLALFCGVGVAMVAGILRVAEPQSYPGAIALRKHLVAARRYFERQLQERHPKLADPWFPYFVALGLAPDVDAWFHTFGEEKSREPDASSKTRSSTTTTMTTAASQSERSASPPPRWTGGGGSFGGAGASGSWSTAATGLASGVAGPSSGSSSSSSSGSSSGSRSSSSSVSSSSDNARSGGGGGGGW